MSHTPGPWRVFDNADHFIIGIGELNGDGITDCGFGIWRGKSEEAQANARLIAAAPDLLAVLPDLLDHYLTCYDGNYDQLATDARAAIAKAEGTEKGEPS